MILTILSHARKFDHDAGLLSVLLVSSPPADPNATHDRPLL